MRRHLVAILFLIMANHWAYSQVSNNEIENRIKLSLNDPWFSSSTRNANVEWDCIDKVLTSTCLVYHNDQWFTIVPPATGTYYVNIKNQRCSNQQGVQIVVLEGDPCKVESYQLKMCISYTDQSDMFVQIDSLIGGKEYLLNIDGYLGDQCEFDIQFSTENNGIPIQSRNLKSIEMKFIPSDTVVKVQWNVPDSLIFKISKLSLYRKHARDKAASLLYTTTLSRNAYGQTESVYSRNDTLRRKGQYIYSIFGHRPEGPVTLLARENFEFKLAEKRQKVYYRANIDYVSPKTGHVAVAVFESGSERPLFTTSRRAIQGKNTLVLDLSDYAREGILYYKIVISDKSFKQEYYYRIKKLLK